MKIIRSLLRIAVTVYLGCLILLFVFQRSLLYYPSHTYVSLQDAQANRALKEFAVRTADGIDLKAWYAPATSKPFTFVFFHGNGDSLYGSSDVGDPYIAAGYGFLIAEYRGYSGLAGKPTEAGLYADARAYLYGLMAHGVKSENIILFGHSLGTGVATQMAEEFHVGGLILLAPYVSIPKMAQSKYPIFPAQNMVLDRFENFKKVKNIHVPVLIVNGTMDEVIPPSQGKQLYDLANEPRQYASLPGHGHNDLFHDFVPLGLDWVSKFSAGTEDLDSRIQ
ncbi:MAG: alpha/beta hydrolase [Terracidiphilus sp.]